MDTVEKQQQIITACKEALDAVLGLASVLTQERDQLRESGNALNREYHALLNEESYAGTRADWMFRSEVTRRRTRK